MKSPNKPNALFFSYQNLKELPGISKKILSQKKAIEDCGFNVFLSHFQNDGGIAKFMIDSKPIMVREGSIIGRLKWKLDKTPILKWIKENDISFIYVRYTKFADTTFVNLFKEIKKLGIRVVLEIPTFPYDKEFRSNSLKEHFYVLLEKLYRKRLSKYVDRISTFSDDDVIFGCPTIKIINGVDPSIIPLKKKTQMDNNCVNLIGVASLNFWHGYDRVIEGMKEYYSSTPKKPVYFHIVGGEKGNKELEKLKRLTNDYSLDKFIFFHGEKTGESLDELFNISDVGIGSLGRHRNGIFKFQSLKNIEYGVRGIPFIYSEISPLFDKEKYTFRCSPDDSPINIQGVIDFHRSLKFSPEEIREECLKKGVDWNSQFKKIFKEMGN